jgi:hypothetical protein
MSSGTGGRRGLCAAVAAAVLGVTGIVALGFARAAAHAPPPPPARLAGPRRVRGGLGNVGREAGDPAVAAPGLQKRRTHIGPVLSRSQPVALDIASVDIHTSLMRLILNPDGTLQPPSEPLKAGWYTGSPTPGQQGPAIIAGHVDSWETGPAVFYRLGSLALGGAIVVTRADGSHAIFTVDAVREYSKADFPTRTVYGGTARAELRLITCGDWDAARREYDGNTVVFAHLVSSTPRA